MKLHKVEFQFDSLSMMELRNLQDRGYSFHAIHMVNPETGETKVVHVPEWPKPGDVVRLKAL